MSEQKNTVNTSGSDPAQTAGHAALSPSDVPIAGLLGLFDRALDNELEIKAIDRFPCGNFIVFVDRVPRGITRTGHVSRQTRLQFLNVRTGVICVVHLSFAQTKIATHPNGYVAVANGMRHYIFNLLLDAPGAAIVRTQPDQSQIITMCWAGTTNPSLITVGHHSAVRTELAISSKGVSLVRVSRVKLRPDEVCEWAASHPLLEGVLIGVRSNNSMHQRLLSWVDFATFDASGFERGEVAVKKNPFKEPSSKRRLFESDPTKPMVVDEASDESATEIEPAQRKNSRLDPVFSDTEATPQRPPASKTIAKLTKLGPVLPGAEDGRMTRSNVI